VRETITGFIGDAIPSDYAPRVDPGIRGLSPVERLFARPAGRFTLAVAAGVLAVAALAGSVRVLPLVLAPGVPPRLVPVLGRGVVAVALETALFVAPPVAFALTASRLVDRGEARALFAIGVRPGRLVAAGWPAMLGVALAAGLAAAAWGREAAAPGRVFREMLAEARAACTSELTPAAAEVPLIGVAWVCVEGAGGPRVVGPAGPGAFTAASIEVSDDLRSFEARDLTLILPAAGEREGSLRIDARSASIRGLPPVGRASNLSVAARAALLALSAPLLAAAAAWVVLRASVRGRTAALAIGAAGPGAALLVFSALERGPASPAAYLAVPAAGLAALLAAGWAAGRRA
jgi:hypothetical protein